MWDLLLVKLCNVGSVFGFRFKPNDTRKGVKFPPF